jgi:YebC/PmpR family DNA-binding regulatory protein
MPKDNIERAIKKGAGEMEGSTYFELTYEGYAPGGVAIIIDTLTDNKNRTAADVRSTLTKLGGSLGATAASRTCSRQRDRHLRSSVYTEDQVLEAALDLGAEDVSSSDGVIEVVTAPSDFVAVLEGLQNKEFEETSASVSKIADTTVSLDNEKTRKVLRIIERLEELDDVQACIPIGDTRGLHRRRREAMRILELIRGLHRQAGAWSNSKDSATGLFRLE